MTTNNLYPCHETRWIDTDVEIWMGFAKSLGDNGLTADARQDCWIAPEVNHQDVYVFLSTNGDPVVIGWIESDGEFRLADGVFDWLYQTEYNWLQQILDAEFLD